MLVSSYCYKALSFQIASIICTRTILVYKNQNNVLSCKNWLKETLIDNPKQVLELTMYINAFFRKLSLK